MPHKLIYFFTIGDPSFLMGLTILIRLNIMKQEKLFRIADLQTGLVLNRKEAEGIDSKSFEYRSLNLRSLNPDGTIDNSCLEKYYAKEELNETFLARRTDIIVGLFPPFNLTLIDEEPQGLVIPSQFVIVRIKGPSPIPGFLFRYLSQKDVLKKSALRESGQITGNLKVSALGNLIIPLPPLHVQREVATYFETSDAYKKLTKELLYQFSLREYALMKNAIGENQHGNN